MNFKAILMGLVVTLGFSVSQANMDLGTVQAMAMAQARTFGIKWHVGDETNHKLTSGFLNGSVHTFVREDSGTEIWMQQDMDLGSMGKQKVEVLFDKNSGQIKKVLANGQEQEIPKTSDYEVVEQKADHITVTAGTFDCMYVKIKEKGKDEAQEQWVNPKSVPIAGILKANSPSQFGTVNQELVSFKFAK